MQSHINVGCGSDVVIASLTEIFGSTISYKRSVRFDPCMPDGALRKWIDSSKLHKLGWFPVTSLQDGVTHTYEYFLREKNSNHISFR
jgi:GDP-L-fucose synthase